MWNQLRGEIQQRRQYLIVISLGCLVMLIGVITSLSSLRFSASSNRFLGPILTFMGFTAILFGVRWRKSILFTEQRQADLNMMGEVPNNVYPTNQMVPFRTSNIDNNYPIHSETGYNTLPMDESKFLVAPAYTAPGFPVHPPPPFPTEPPPPYEPPAYEVAASYSTISATTNPTTSRIPYPTVLTTSDPTSSTSGPTAPVAPYPTTSASSNPATSTTSNPTTTATSDHTSADSLPPVS